MKDRHQSGDVQLHVVISLANVGNTCTVVVRPDVSANTTDSIREMTR